MDHGMPQYADIVGNCSSGQRTVVLLLGVLWVSSAHHACTALARIPAISSPTVYPRTRTRRYITYMKTEHYRVVYLLPTILAVGQMKTWMARTVLLPVAHRPTSLRITVSYFAVHNSASRGIQPEHARKPSFASSSYDRTSSYGGLDNMLSDNRLPSDGVQGAGGISRGGSAMSRDPSGGNWLLGGEEGRTGMIDSIAGENNGLPGPLVLDIDGFRAQLLRPSQVSSHDDCWYGVRVPSTAAQVTSEAIYIAPKGQACVPLVGTLSFVAVAPALARAP